jgi:hypothetical protein
MRFKIFIRAFVRTKKIKTLILLGTGKISNFRIKKSIFNTGYSMESTWCSFDADPKFLKVYIHGVGFVSIEESPHYAHIQSVMTGIGSEESYKKYLQEYYPQEDLNKSISRFDLLFAELSRGITPEAILVELPIANTCEINVVDGTHRLAICITLGFDKIRCKGKL